ncbi:MAG: hypothetical protein HXX20_21395 [Chloroflexi bacterium]|nr:hypothetical protein [Chloroflexota bacterium]
MTGDYFLNWATMTASLFNTVLLLWLGLIVLLNAEHRNRGSIWLAAGGLLLGAAFFISHSAIIGQGIRNVSQGMNFWWYAGWIPVMALPFAWYMVMLWYAGFWKKEPTYHQQRYWFGLTLLVGLAFVGLFFFANPLPSYTQVVQLDLMNTPGIGGIPLLVLAYPCYSVMCLTLSLTVLREPTTSGRVMGDLARRRARPWLAATSVMLLLVSLLVAVVMFWIIINARQRTLYNLHNDMEIILAWFDLLIASLVALSILLLGQAVVSYEIFTGNTLPRRGLRGQWYSAISLAAGYSLILGGSMANQLRPIYSLLLTTILMTLFYALFSWRAYVERERYIKHLRPFVASQGLYDYLLTPSANLPKPAEVKMQRPFQALCADILDAKVAYLVALGPLSPLIGPALTYPDKTLVTALPALADLTAQFNSPQIICVPLDPIHYGGAVWAIPLWSTRGLIGVLLLGEKSGGGLYSQEEIEIAQASGERLIDTQASAEMAQRLMALQRQRLVESQILDRRTRQVLHDEVLPLLHTAMLMLSNRQAFLPEKVENTSAETVALLTDAHRQISNLLREMPTSAAPKVAHLGLLSALQQVVAEELGHAFDKVSWEIEPEANTKLQGVPPLATEILFYAAREALRNAARYGRPPVSSRPFYLKVVIRWHEGLEISIEDNGIGFGTVTSAKGGSGQGLALHSTLMAVMGGSLVVESVPDNYTHILLTLPQGV